MTMLDPNKRDLDRRLERVGWGLFLIMLGGLAFIPQVPGGLWLVGAGIIMLGLNAARYSYGIPMSLFSLGLGVLAILLGLASIFGFDLPLFPLLLILIGANLVYKAWRRPTA